MTTAQLLKENPLITIIVDDNKSTTFIFAFVEVVKVPSDELVTLERRAIVAFFCPRQIKLVNMQLYYVDMRDNYLKIANEVNLHVNISLITSHVDIKKSHVTNLSCMSTTVI